MSRGWESKDVESQMEEAASARMAVSPPLKTPEQREVDRKRGLLQLDRTRILSELQPSCNPRRRGMLEGALAHLESEIAKLG